MKKILFIFFCVIKLNALAQLPETVVYLFDIERSMKGYHFLPPKIISRTSGYNNQPYFSPDDKYVYYISSIDTTNTEIYRYDLKRKKSKRLTTTREPEYSPKYTMDDAAISCVSVEKDKTTQHLYTYNLKGKKPQVILPQLKTIGYYEWLSGIEFLSFELPEPFYFVRHNLALNKADTLATNIGRTFYWVRTKGKIVYIDKSDSLHYKIRTVAQENLRTSRKKSASVENPVLAETLPGEEDFCFMQDGSVLMGHDGMLYYKKNPFRHPESPWDELVDLKQFGINQFYRIAINGDNTKLAVVAFKGKKP